MARALVLTLGVAIGNRFGEETAGMDRLTVPATWLTSGPTVEETSRTTGVVIEVTSLVGLVTEVIGTLLNVDPATEERFLASVLAGTTDLA